MPDPGLRRWLPLSAYSLCAMRPGPGCECAARLSLPAICDFGGCAVAANINSAEGRIGDSAVAAKVVFGGHSAAGKLTQLW